MTQDYNRVHLGDNGTSQVGLTPQRLPKSDVLFDFYGIGDKFIASLNLSLLKCSDKQAKKILEFLIEVAYKLLSVVLSPNEHEDELLRILKRIEQYVIKFEKTATTDRFIYHFRNEFSAYLNFSRTIVREWERSYYKAVNHSKNLNFYKPLAQVLNRLSTLLFTMSLFYEFKHQEGTSQK